MKHKKLFILSMLLMMVGNILADNISINDVTLSAGEEKQITINLTNTENNYVAFQFDLVLPAGVTVAKDNKGRFAASITEERTIDHTLTVADVGSNTFRFLSYSGTNSEFYGKDGALLNVTLKADDSFGYGDFTATIVNPKFTFSSGTKITLSETSFIISNPKLEEPIITITAKNATRLYGEANPAFEYDVTGGTLNGVPDFTCTATPLSPVGKYEIVVSKGTITNENVVFVNGTLDVLKAPLTIKADDKQMMEGDALPAFTATYTGFKNDETESVLTKSPVFQCAATTTSAAGTYEIIPSGAEAQNYDIAYNNGILTITQRPEPVQNGKLSVENIELNAGEAKNIAFNLATGNNQYVAFQFDLIVPEGMSIAKDEKGRFVANLNEDRRVDHTLTISEVATNTYRILSYSGTNAEFSGNSGAIMFVQLKADNSMMEGKYDASINNQKFTLADGTKHSFDNTSFAITISIEKITVTAKNAIRKYGDANPTFEYTVLPEGSSLSGEPELTCVAMPTSPVGQYEIVVSRGSITNENVTFVNGTLDVQKAPLTIKADDKQMTQGNPLPEFTATYTGFKNNETETALTKKPEFNCTATSDSPAGTYDIIPSNAEAQNYEMYYENGILTIIEKPDDFVIISNPIAGELASQISATGYQKSEIKSMKVSGNLNGTDIKCIREMVINGSLTQLDISKASIVSGGKAYYDSYKTEDGVIGEYMFSDCRGLTLLLLPETTTSIAGWAFLRCHGLVNIEIPLNCQSIGHGSITYCDNLERVLLPTAIEEINTYNFISCPKFTTIEVDNRNTKYKSVEGVLFTYDMNTIVRYPMGRSEKEYNLPNTVTIIEDYAFYSAKLENVFLPEALSYIGEYAFDMCSNLIGINIPESVTAIGNVAFGHCYNLESFRFPSKIEKVSNLVLCYCNNLTSVYLSPNTKSIGNSAFVSCKSLSTIYCPVNSIKSVTVDDKAFDGITLDCIWHIVKDTPKEDYTEQDWWVDSWLIVDDITCGVIPLTYLSGDNDAWYTLQGVKLDGKPTKQGIYVHGGKKVIIK